MGDHGTLNLLVTLEAGPDADPEACERASRRLRVELAELDVDSVHPAPGPPAPQGAKCGDPVSVGAIVVALSASGGVLPTVLGTLRDWLGRQPGGHRVKVTAGDRTLELDAASAGEQKELVAAFIQHAMG